MRKVVLWSLASGIVLVLLWAFAVRLGLLGTKDEPALGVRDRVAPFRLPLAGEADATLSLQQLRGKGVLLNFWATWCEPCIKELPLLERIHARYGGLHFVVVGVTDEDPADVERFLARRPIDYPILIDRSGRLRAHFGAEALPFTAWIGPDGRVAGRELGVLREVSANQSAERLIIAARKAQRTPETGQKD